MTDLLADTENLVNETFEQVECAWDDGSPHVGTKVAFFNYHGCQDGWWCEFHYHRFINEHLPLIEMMAGTPKGVCQECHSHFPTVESYVKVYPL